MTATAAERTSRALDELREQSEGNLHVDLVGPDDLLGLVACAVSGDRESATLLRRVQSALNAIDARQDAGEPVRCCGCEHVFDEAPCRVAVLRPYPADRRAYAALALCEACDAEPLTALRRGGEAMGLTGARVGFVNDAVGHA